MKRKKCGRRAGGVPSFQIPTVKREKLKSEKGKT
jgi:hypothetical protein